MDVLQKIDSLQVSDSWKVKFKTIAEANPLNYGLVIKFEKNDVWQKSSLWTKFNPLAMLFGVFYYVAKGLWKKGLLLLVIGIGLISFAETVFGGKVGDFIAIGYNAVYATYANLDFYRKKVLDEDFWL
jgi:hypothetical protein